MGKLSRENLFRTDSWASLFVNLLVFAHSHANFPLADRGRGRRGVVHICTRVQLPHIYTKSFDDDEILDKFRADGILGMDRSEAIFSTNK